MENDKNQIKQYAIDTFEAEAAAVRNLSNLLTDDFAKAVEAILKCTGKVVVTGMGKSGIIGKRLPLHWPVRGRLRSFCIRERPIMVIWE